jgi:hypothetical protein
LGGPRLTFANSIWVEIPFSLPFFQENSCNWLYVYSRITWFHKQGT